MHVHQHNTKHSYYNSPNLNKSYDTELHQQYQCEK